MNITASNNPDDLQYLIPLLEGFLAELVIPIWRLPEGSPGRVTVVVGEAPTSWVPLLQEGILLKRQGRYYGAAQIIIDLSHENSVTYTTPLRNLYKLTAVAGDLVNAQKIINEASASYRSEVIGNWEQRTGLPTTSPEFAQDSQLEFELIQNKFELDRYLLAEAIRSEATLHRYLSEISGNINYELPLPYAELRRRWDEAYTPSGPAWLEIMAKRRGEVEISGLAFPRLLVDYVEFSRNQGRASKPALGGDVDIKPTNTSPVSVRSTQAPASSSSAQTQYTRRGFFRRRPS